MARASLFGRQEELAQAYHLLDEARAGASRVLLIEGDPGIGKTALASAIVDRAVHEGFEVLSGRAHENLSAAMLPIAEAFAPLLAEDSAATNPALSAIRNLLYGTPAEPANTDSGAGANVRALLELVRSIHERAAVRPIVLWFDDAHWISAAGIEVLTHLTLAAVTNRGQAGPRALIVLTFRKEGVPAELRRLVRQLRREPACALIDLPPLDELSLFELARESLRQPPTPTLVAELAEYSRGNPLLAQELLRLAGREGSSPTHLGATGGAWRDVAELLGEEFGQLSGEARRVIATASFLEEPLDCATLAEVANVPEEAAREHLVTAERRGLIERTDGDAFRFSHPLHWQVAYLHLPAAARAAVHATIARVLLRRGPTGVAEFNVTVAHHMTRSGHLRPTLPPAFDLLSAAAARAFAIGAWDEATRFYEDARAHAPTPDLELAYRAALARYRSHDVEGALGAFREVARDAEQRGDFVLAAQAMLGTQRALLAHRARPGEAGAHLTELARVIAQLEPDSDLRSRAEHAISETHFAGRAFGDAVEHAWLAASLAEQAQDVGCRVQALVALGLGHWGQLSLREALQCFEEADAQAKHVSDMWMRGLAPVRRALVLDMTGNIRAADRAIDEALGTYQASRDWSNHSLAHTSLAIGALGRGDLVRAERHALVALSMVDRSEYIWTRDIANPVLVCARALRGDWDEARDTLMAWGGGVDRPWDHWALVNALQFGLAHAERALREQAGRAGRSRPPDLFSLGATCALAELALTAGDAAVTARVLPALSAAREQGVLVPLGWSAFLPSLVARASALVGSAHDVAPAFEAAIALAADHGLQLELARGQLAYAQWLFASDRSTARARELASAAATAFHEFGAAPLGAVALALLGGPGLSSARVPTSAAPGGLTAREIEVLRALTHGLTNDQIAESLVISPATARRHVANIYLKLDIPNRAAAAAYCIEHGLLDEAGGA